MKPINFKSEQNTGLSSEATQNAGRYYIDNGVPNVGKINVPFFKRLNFYHYLIHLNSIKFLAIIFSGFIALNLLFAGGYYLIGVNQLSGLSGATHSTNFSDVFFFSCQTFTTVGYGGIHPIGFWSSALSSLESLIGLLSFALITGLIYGRFSRPRALIDFTTNILIAPYKDGLGLMVRAAPYSKHVLSNVVANVTMAVKEKNPNTNIYANKFYQLPLELKTINSFLLSWTLVHPIDDESPLKGLTLQDLKEKQFELLVFLTAFDESFSNQVIRRQSYIANDIIWGAKFEPMINPSANQSKTLLDFNKLNTMHKVEIPEIL